MGLQLGLVTKDPEVRYHAKDRREGREGVVRNLRFRTGDAREEGGFPCIGKADQPDLRDELQFEPQLAPLAQKYGPQLVGALSKDITLDLGLLTGGAGSGAGGGASGTGGATSGGGAAKSGSADPATSEKAQLMELQRLQDRDKELFTLFSNMLKAMHDARMTAIQNIR